MHLQILFPSCNILPTILLTVLLTFVVLVDTPVHALTGPWRPADMREALCPNAGFGVHFYTYNTHPIGFAENPVAVESEVTSPVNATDCNNGLSTLL